ncbi:MAG TPA: FlgD immunoglobulin-like domain containing protein, partial [bacterium]|nr:FlgD immunoglobulin-like domain containing protein [bacterium]
FDLMAGGLLYPTGGDKSAADGTYGIRLPAGSYLIVANPPAGSADPPDSTTILLSSDTLHDFALGGGAVSAPLATAAAAATRLSSFPNPFASSTTFSFDLPAGSRGARVSVYDTAGRLVRVLDAAAAPGSNRVTWDGRDDQQRRVASGVYLYRLNAAGESVTNKVVVLR